MKLVWTFDAIADRQGIYDYIEKRNPAAAIALDELFSRRAAQLARHAMLGRPGRVPDTRELVVHRSYILVYDVTDSSVRVLRVLHAARRWPSAPADA